MMMIDHNRHLRISGMVQGEHAKWRVKVNISTIIFTSALPVNMHPTPTTLIGVECVGGTTTETLSIIIRGQAMENKQKALGIIRTVKARLDETREFVESLRTACCYHEGMRDSWNQGRQTLYETYPHMDTLGELRKAVGVEMEKLKEASELYDYCLATFLGREDQ